MPNFMNLPNGSWGWKGKTATRGDWENQTTGVRGWTAWAVFDEMNPAAQFCWPMAMTEKSSDELP